MVVVVTALVLGLGPSLSCDHGGCGGSGSGRSRGRHMVVVVGQWAMVTDCCAGGRRHVAAFICACTICGTVLVRFKY